jgi:hypothetical protein
LVSRKGRLTTEKFTERIYLPVLRFGITDEDWGLVIVAAILGYAVPFLFGLKLGPVPLELIGWVAATGLTIVALNLLRRKSRPAWLRHGIQAKVQGGSCRRRLPADAAHPWRNAEEDM